MIYVITASGGDYEDRWTKCVAATHDRALAETEVAKLVADQEHLEKTSEQLFNAFHEWYAANPMPPRPKFIPFPNIDYRKATPVQKAEHEANTKVNAAENVKWSKLQEAWATKAQAFTDAERLSLGIAPEVTWYGLLSAGNYTTIPTQLRYEIEELEELQHV